jgi:superfamily II DNA/RNA helicase
MARRFMRQPTHIRAEEPDEGRTVPDTKIFVYRAHSMDKGEELARILQAEGRGLCMVFTRTKRSADRIAADLADRGFAAAAVHGDLGQGAREQALRAFRNGKVDVLVATDVAARGIDVAGVTHVVNYECPDDEKTYVHRIGRTGRAGEAGTAITFVDWEDGYRWGMINKALDLPFPEPEETYSTSDYLYDELEIPKTATGRLPRAQRTRAGLEAEEIEDLGETGRRRPPGGRDGNASRDGGRSRGGRGGGERSGGQRSRSGSSDRPKRDGAPAGGDKATAAPRKPRQRTRRRLNNGDAGGNGNTGSSGPAAG